MNSYINPAHEETACATLKKFLPDVYVTYSTDLTREWYEYERCSTVAANAYVGPQVSTYIRRLDSVLKKRGFPGTLFMMGSNGGLLSAERTCRQPIGLVESGPIGGCIGAGAYAEKLGFKNVVAFDMGGTTAKCALVENGRYSVNSLYYANGYVKGFPIKSAVIDIVEFSRDLEKQNWTTVAASAAELMTETEQQYYEMSRYAVSPELHEVQADYLRSLQELNQAAEEGSKAVVASTGNNSAVASEHSGMAESHLKSAGSYLDRAVKGLYSYVKEKGSS